VLDGNQNLGAARHRKLMNERGLVVAGSDASELLQPVEHALDAISILVGFEVAGDWILAVRFGGMTGKIPCIKSDERTSSPS
jgi:hypothetical protein